MAVELSELIPLNAEQAKQRGLRKLPKVGLHELAERDKTNTLLIGFKADGQASTICYYDPNTGGYDDCYSLS